MGQQYNAVTHGLYAKEALLPFENRRQYLRFCREFVKSLAPENEIQTHLARDIAEDAWKITRLDRTINALQAEIYERLTPLTIAEVAQLPKALHEVAPDWLVQMDYKVDKAKRQLHHQVCEQYEHCLANFASIPNLVAVYKQYPQLFPMACQMAQNAGKRPILNSATNSLDAAWQQSPKALWQMLEHAYQNAYFYAHWERIRKIAGPWVESWYFIEAGKSLRLQHHQSLALKARADFRKQLQAYERLKKNAILFSAAVLSYAQDQSKEINAANAKRSNEEVSDPVAQDALVYLSMPAMQAYLNKVHVHGVIASH